MGATAEVDVDAMRVYEAEISVSAELGPFRADGTVLPAGLNGHEVRGFGSAPCSRSGGRNWGANVGVTSRGWHPRRAAWMEKAPPTVTIVWACRQDVDAYAAAGR